MDKTTLRLHEEMLLLLLKDEEGTFHPGWRNIAMGAALLSELLLSEHVRPETSNRGRDLVVADPWNVPVDPLLAECHGAIAESAKPRSASHWVGKFGNQRGLAQRIAEELAGRGILRIDRESILLIFKRAIYPEVDPGPEDALLRRMWEAITSTKAVDPRTAVIVGLAHHTGLMPRLFGKAALRTYRECIESLANGDAAVAGAKEAVKAAQAALMVAVIMPAMVVTSVTTS